MWKLELDEEFFRILDSKKLVAGYFDPDYGIDFSSKNSEEQISLMLKNHEKVSGGLIMVPLVKFELFDTDLNTTLSNVEQNVTRVTTHLKKWKNFLSQTNRQVHSVRISHTDQDMLTITFEARFPNPIPLEKTKLLQGLCPTLDLLRDSELL
ncbi:MAG: hypothetical protein ACR2LL_01915 [Nitrosopumilus sp.]